MVGLSLAAPAGADDTDADSSEAGRSSAAGRAESPSAATAERTAAARDTARRAAQPGRAQLPADEAVTETPKRAAAAVDVTPAETSTPALTEAANTGRTGSPVRDSRRTARAAESNAAESNAAKSTVLQPPPDAPPLSATPVQIPSPLPSAGVPLPQPATTTAEAAAEVPATATPVRVRAASAAVATAGIPAGDAAATSVADVFTGLLAPIQALIEGVGLLIRRTFFNQAPQVNPVQTTGQMEGPITGTIGAVDPEGEQITYQITQAPQYGSVVVGADGGFTYTPGPDFSGLDAFNVAADDVGFGFNLFDLGRPTATEAYVQVAQNADQPLLTFAFSYGAGSQYWSAAARAALQSAAITLARYIVVDTPTTLNFDITAENSPSSSTLASAWSNLITSDAGFHPTVAQHKILTGVDANGSAADGDISVNFGASWGLGPTVGSGQYDFTSIAMHEMVHTLGFLTYADRPGSNIGQYWTVYDSFLVDSTGNPVIGEDYRWNSAYNLNLTGRNGGLFFGGPNAVAVYGGLVPLYTPTSWDAGSSVSHLDDRTFGSEVMMTALQRTGLDVRVLSPLELAILQDLGYDVSPSPLAAFALLGFGFLRRPARRR